LSRKGNKRLEQGNRSVDNSHHFVLKEKKLLVVTSGWRKTEHIIPGRGVSWDALARASGS
jgi:hypothetical protein